MTNEKYENFTMAITTTTLDGFTSNDVSECLRLVKEAKHMETAIIRAIMALESAKSDCPHGRIAANDKSACTNCSNLTGEHFCPKTCADMLKRTIQTPVEKAKELKNLLAAKHTERMKCIKEYKPIEMACELCERQSKCQILQEIAKIEREMNENN